MATIHDGTTRPDPPGQYDRRSFWLAAVVMTGALVVLIGLFVVFFPRESERGLTKQQQTDKALTNAPHIIPTPADGRGPANPGDPGGWEQLALLGMIVVGLAVVVLLIWRSSRRARAEAARTLSSSVSPR